MKAYHVGLLASFILSPSLVFAAQSSSARAVFESRYTKAHSLDDSYSFDPRDGWQSINATNLQYKYRRQEEPDPDSTGDLRGNSPSLVNRSKKNVQTAQYPPHKAVGLGYVIAGVVADISKGLKGLGKPQPAIITWYFSYFVPAGTASHVFSPGIRDMTWIIPAAGKIVNGRPRSVVFMLILSRLLMFCNVRTNRLCVHSL